MQFAIFEDFITPPSPCRSNTYKRNFNNFNKNKLKKDLTTTDWDNEIYKHRENMQIVFSIFYKTLSEIVDLHVLLTRITKNELTLQLKSYI